MTKRRLRVLQAPSVLCRPKDARLSLQRLSTCNVYQPADQQCMPISINTATTVATAATSVSGFRFRAAA